MADKEKVLFRATVCLLVRGGKVLLARKKRKIGAGKWNGYGGSAEHGETWTMAGVRELREEAGIDADPRKLELVAIIDFHNNPENSEAFTCRVFVFLVRQWNGEPTESAEMGAPKRFDTNRLPFDEMLLADRVWMPHVLSGKKIVAEATYGPRQETLIGEVSVKVVSDFTEFL